MSATNVGTHNGRILMERLLEISSSPRWLEAKREWRLECVYLLDPGDEPQRCLCTHYPIREVCVIRNDETGHSAVVGNKCVRQFLGMEDADDVVNNLRRVRDRPDKASLSPAAARYAHERGWLTEWELKFCLNIAGKRKLRGNQPAKRAEINRLVVFRMRQDAANSLEG